MSELSFQTAGEANDPSTTPCPDYVAGGVGCVQGGFSAQVLHPMLLQKSHIEMQTWR